MPSRCWTDCEGFYRRDFLKLGAAGLFGGARPETRDAAYDFVKQNWDALVAKLPTDFGASLPFVAGRYCDNEHRSDVQHFFKDRSTKYAGGPRNLEQVLESISLCAASKICSPSSVWAAATW